MEKMNTAPAGYISRIKHIVKIAGIWRARKYSWLIPPFWRYAYRNALDYYASDAPHRVCHYNELFVNHKGDVFPCCLVWMKGEMRIGHIDDNDIEYKIANYFQKCQCAKAKLIQGNAGIPREYTLLNIELSLKCQGQCAMCCVNAPEWEGQYEYYGQLDKLINTCHPKEILVQGGEILIQKRTLDWLKMLRIKYPSMNISLVTNGNVNIDMVDEAEALFHRIAVSIIGFQPETYRAIMGMNIEKTFAFINELLRRKKTKVYLKYLTLPNNIHEAHLFLRWAIPLLPARIVFHGSGMHRYIQSTSDGYWDKIIKRSARDFQKEILQHKEDISLKATIISMDAENRRLFGVTQEFINKHKLENVFRHDELY